ncbi:hypothetical protein Bca4012_060117 [Brassica carinata]
MELNQIGDSKCSEGINRKDAIVAIPHHTTLASWLRFRRPLSRRRSPIWFGEVSSAGILEKSLAMATTKRDQHQLKWKD